MPNVNVTPYLKHSRAQLRALAKSLGYNVNALLSKPESNTKIAKNLTRGIMTAPLHLAPAALSGYEVCPKRTAGCTDACLNVAGRGRFASVQVAREARTKLYFEARDIFMAWLYREIESLVKRANNASLTPSVRLNATSDIPWERVRIEGIAEKPATLMELFPNVQFYDYTKRARRNVPSNYHLTFSLAEDNDDDATTAIRNGMNVAVVFDTKRGQPLPASMNLGGDDYRVIDGDEHDYRPLDGSGLVVGLRAKGDAIGDTSGFVRAAA